MACGPGSAGYKGKPYISTDGGTIFLIVSSAKDMNITKNHSPIDVTSFDSVDGWKSFIEGLKDWAVEMEYIYLEADAGQEGILGAITEGTELVFQYRPRNESGAKMYEGTVLVKEWALSNALEDAVGVSASFQGCGKPTELTVP